MNAIIKKPVSSSTVNPVKNTGGGETKFKIVYFKKHPDPDSADETKAEMTLHSKVSTLTPAKGHSDFYWADITENDVDFGLWIDNRTISNRSVLFKVELKGFKIQQRYVCPPGHRGLVTGIGPSQGKFHFKSSPSKISKQMDGTKSLLAFCAQHKMINEIENDQNDLDCQMSITILYSRVIQHEVPSHSPLFESRLGRWVNRWRIQRILDSIDKENYKGGDEPRNVARGTMEGGHGLYIKNLERGMMKNVEKEKLKDTKSNSSAAICFGDKRSWERAKKICVFQVDSGIRVTPFVIQLRLI